MLKNHPRTRLALYLVSIGAAVAAPFATLAAPDLGAAFVTASSVLAAAAGATALTNLDTAD